MKEFLIGNSGISYQQRYLNYICKYCWNVVAYEWKVYIGKNEIISLVLRFRYKTGPQYQFLEQVNKTEISIVVQR